MKIKRLARYWTDKTNEAYKRYDIERAAQPRDGQDWKRGPLPTWIEYQRCGDEIGNLLMPFERLTNRRWDWMPNSSWLGAGGGINDRVWDYDYDYEPSCED